MADRLCVTTILVTLKLDLKRVSAYIDNPYQALGSSRGNTV